MGKRFYGNKTATVKIHTLNIRKEASRDSDVLKVVHKGDKLEVAKEGEDWTQLDEGFVMSRHIDVEVAELPAAASALSEDGEDD